MCLQLKDKELLELKARTYDMIGREAFPEVSKTIAMEIIKVLVVLKIHILKIRINI